MKKRKISDQVKEVSKEEPKSVEAQPFEGYLDTCISTGSTLLDLAVSGGVTKEGGIPGGILFEIFGPSSTGKTAVLAELCASAVIRGGDFVFLDPEARLDKSYTRIYDVHIDKKNYESPDTVEQVFDYIYNWKPEAKGVNVIVNDSIASLSTQLEMDTGDKMGMARGKAFSAGLRKTCRLIRKNNWIVACSNQIRQSQYGEFTPGGFGVPFHASLRMRISFAKDRYIEKKVKLESGVEVQETKGIHSVVTVIKSSVDVPYRSADIYIIFGHGIDDIRANLLFCKKYTGATMFDCFDREYTQTERAIQYIEENNLEDKLRERTIEVWNNIKDKLHVPRKPKVRR